MDAIDWLREQVVGRTIVNVEGFPGGNGVLFDTINLVLNNGDRLQVHVVGSPMLVGNNSESGDK